MEDFINKIVKENKIRLTERFNKIIEQLQKSDEKK